MPEFCAACSPETNRLPASPHQPLLYITPLNIPLVITSVNETSKDQKQETMDNYITQQISIFVLWFYPGSQIWNSGANMLPLKNLLWFFPLQSKTER